MSAEIIIEEYDPRWPLEFEKLRARIEVALEPLAAAIEHIGSTAVPGLAAKPIIDIDVLLTPDAEFAQAVSALSSAGYEYRGDLGIRGREAFRAPTDSYPHHLYVCRADAGEFHRHIEFRDHLRSHPEDVEAYASLKRRLMREFAWDREGYTQGKSEFVERILRRDGEQSGRGARILR
jgi:GrpB-like predicted nucleotidyltransferase (UPF0157 family)